MRKERRKEQGCDMNSNDHDFISFTLYLATLIYIIASIFLDF